MATLACEQETGVLFQGPRGSGVLLSLGSKQVDGSIIATSTKNARDRIIVSTGSGAET